MSKTHTGEVSKAAKEIAKWLAERLGSNAPSPTTTDIMTRIHSRHQHPTFSTEDQIAIGRTALVLLKHRFPGLWDKYRNQNPDVMDRSVPQEIMDSQDPEDVAIRNFRQDAIDK